VGIDGRAPLPFRHASGSPEDVPQPTFFTFSTQVPKRDSCSVCPILLSSLNRFRKQRGGFLEGLRSVHHPLNNPIGGRAEPPSPKAMAIRPTRCRSEVPPTGRVSPSTARLHALLFFFSRKRNRSLAYPCSDGPGCSFDRCHLQFAGAFPLRPLQTFPESRFMAFSVLVTSAKSSVPLQPNAESVPERCRSSSIQVEGLSDS